jgi:hypothetical protein
MGYFDGSACGVVGPTPTQQIAAGLAPVFSFVVPGLFFGRARMGLAWGWQQVGMGPHGVGMGLARG